MKKVLFLLAASVLFGCLRLAILKEGIKQPALENYESLTGFLLKMKIDTTEVLCFSDTNALNKFSSMRIGLPEARFFNRERNLVDYKESPQDCNGMVSVFLEKVESINQLSPVPNEHLEDYLKNLVYEKDMRPFLLRQKDHDLYIVIYWAKYLGKMNKHKVFEWLSLVEDARARGLKVRVIKINADYQQVWGITQGDLPRFKFQ